MSQAFFTGQTGEPALTKCRVAPQTVEGVPALEAAYSDYRAFSAQTPLTPQLIERMALTGNSINKLRALIGKIGGSMAQSIGDVDPMNKMLLNALANITRKYTNTDNTTWRRWTFSPSAATTAAAYLSMLIDNDVLPRVRYRDVALSALRLAAAPNENFAAEFDAVYSEFDFHGVPTQTVGTGSTIPIMRGFWSGNLVPDATDKDIFIKLINVLTFLMQGKVTTAASYGASNDSYALGSHSRVYNEAVDPIDRIIGNAAEQVRAYWPEGATLVNNDVFQIAKRRAAWTPSYPADRSISSVQTIFYLNSGEVRVERGWNVEINVPGVARRDDTGGRQSARVRKTGALEATISMTRELADLDLQIALLNQGVVTIAIEAKTDVEISTSGRPYRFLQVYPACVPDGETFSVDAGGQNRDESLRLVAGLPDSAFAYNDGSGSINFSDAVNFVVENDVATL